MHSARPVATVAEVGSLGAERNDIFMKYIPGIAAVVAQQGATIFIMEEVRRDLFLAVGVSAVVGFAVYFLCVFLLQRITSHKVKL